ncbi:MAG TPA: heavy-metal-associated domain-containing protein [Vineibacter sp.]|nr:heavy-metal-associated domain-containing protein [Vineibacter sp.]
MSIFKVEGMTCGHCVAAVTRSIQQAVPGASVDVDLARGEVKVELAPDRAVIVAAVKQAGYAVVDAA